MRHCAVSFVYIWCVCKHYVELAHKLYEKIIRIGDNIYYFSMKGEIRFQYLLAKRSRPMGRVTVDYLWNLCTLFTVFLLDTISIHR